MHLGNTFTPPLAQKGNYSVIMFCIPTVYFVVPESQESGVRTDEAFRKSLPLYIKIREIFHFHFAFNYFSLGASPFRQTSI